MAPHQSAHPTSSGQKTIPIKVYSLSKKEYTMIVSLCQHKVLFDFRVNDKLFISATIRKLCDESHKNKIYYQKDR